MRNRERNRMNMWDVHVFLDFRSETKNQKAPKNSFIQDENGG